MSKKLTKNEKTLIMNRLLGWSKPKITWEELCEECATFLSNRPSRQTLSYHNEIKEAFKSKKNGIKDNHNNFKKPSSLSIASQRIFHLESRLQLLEVENRNLKQQFVLWQYNAFKHNITKHILDEPLPLIDRRRTDRKLT
ncbi:MULTISPECIES: hypothetical protein [Rahnella]|uniref:Myb-like domain-containing protein n=1 Tax=Rahnella laticis TaxID=2787622 RepID=A0ABS0EC55_9GAMM|nr:MULTISPECIES: hypothetical protein [Rahnella]MBF7982658.1 hypothetical protein [Rahnella laticis]MBF8002851.1 hypothetical protein [Rahnella sp. LAC-M12]